MQTRDQRYARDIHERVQEIKKESEVNYRKYGTMCHKLPILIHKAGLAQALAFVDSRASTSKGEIYKRFLSDLAQTVEQPALVKDAREAELSEYMYLTRQVMDALLWYKRFAQSVLGVDASASVEEEG